MELLLPIPSKVPEHIYCTMQTCGPSPTNQRRRATAPLSQQGHHQRFLAWHGTAWHGMARCGCLCLCLSLSCAGYGVLYRPVAIPAKVPGSPLSCSRVLPGLRQNRIASCCCCFCFCFCCCRLRSKIRSILRGPPPSISSRQHLQVPDPQVQAKARRQRNKEKKGQCQSDKRIHRKEKKKTQFSMACIFWVCSLTGQGPVDFRRSTLRLIAHPHPTPSALRLLPLRLIPSPPLLLFLFLIISRVLFSSSSSGRTPVC